MYLVLLADVEANDDDDDDEPMIGGGIEKWTQLLLLLIIQQYDCWRLSHSCSWCNTTSSLRLLLWFVTYWKCNFDFKSHLSLKNDLNRLFHQSERLHCLSAAESSTVCNNPTNEFSLNIFSPENTQWEIVLLIVVLHFYNLTDLILMSLRFFASLHASSIE